MTAEATHRRAKMDLTSGSLVGHLFRMAGPSALGIVLHSLYSLVDTFWLGKLGTVAIASPVRPDRTADNTPMIMKICKPLTF